MSKILSWYIDQKVKYELEVEKIPLNRLEIYGWGNNKYKIFKDDR